jgi:hypothetical protein
MRKPLTIAILAGGLVVFYGESRFATSMQGGGQACLHGPDETPQERARRREALGAARAINTAQANDSAARGGRYLRHDELARSSAAQKLSSTASKPLNLAPGEEILPGWLLTLKVGDDGYWFMVKDKTDPCGFAYISNEEGLIYTAEPIR